MVWQKTGNVKIEKYSVYTARTDGKPGLAV